MTETVCCTCLVESVPDTPYYKLDSDPTVTDTEKLLYYIPEFEEVSLFWMFFFVEVSVNFAYQLCQLEIIYNNYIDSVVQTRFF